MGYQTFRFPDADLDLIAKKLQAIGADVVRRDGPGRFGSLRSARGWARARVFDVTEKKDAVPHFNVATGRDGLFSAIFLWPIDRKHVREVEDLLKESGAVEAVPDPK